MFARSRRTAPGSFLPLALAAIAAAQGGSTTVPHLTPADAVHLLNRTTFGPSPADVARLDAGPETLWDAWLEEQLHPDTIVENQKLADVLLALNLPPGATATPPGLTQLRRAQIAIAMCSARQLQAVMGELLWTHFNTDWNSARIFFFQQNGGNTVLAEQTATHVTWAMSEMLRQSAFGDFRTLIERVTLSPMMLIYLNGVSNVDCFGNENFARELLELMTMGITYQGNDLPTHPPGSTNYGQVELDGIQRILSGHTIDLGAPPPYAAKFDAARHCNLPVPVLFAATPFPLTITTSGQAQLGELFDWLAASPFVQDFVCRKLIRVFVGDAAADVGRHDGLVAEMKAAWGTRGNLRAVLRVLLTSRPFRGDTYRWQRACNPLEVVVRPFRVFDMQLGAGASRLFIPDTSVAAIGFPQREFPSPDGPPLASEEQLGSSVSMESFLAGGQVYRQILQFSQPYQLYPLPPLGTLLNGKVSDIHDADEVAGYLLKTMFPAAWSATDRQVIRTALSTPVATIDPGTSSTLAANPGQMPGYPFETQLAAGLGTLFNLVKASLK
jgi:uncharacterized protein (DUF1800 family)